MEFVWYNEERYVFYVLNIPNITLRIHDSTIIKITFVSMETNKTKIYGNIESYKTRD